MKIAVLQENIHKDLGKTIRIISSKPQLPVLAYVHISGKNGQVFLTTTNLETTIQIKTAGKVEEEGEICIPARIFYELVSLLPKETVLLDTQEETITVQTQKTKATVPGIVATEFPPVPEISASQGVYIPNNTVRSVLEQVLFAAATDETRPLLTGIRVENTPEGTTFVATDGYRLSIKKIPNEKISEGSLVIPSRALVEVLKVSSEEKDQTKIRLSETVDGQLLFEIGDTKIMTRRIEGDFPNYQRIIPSSYTTELRVDSQELYHAVKSAAIFARDSSGIIRFSITQTGLSVSANTPHVGENTIDVEARVEGDGGNLALNSRFLLDLLSSFPAKELVLQMTGALNPAVFLIPDDNTYLHIIMPVRVQT